MQKPQENNCDGVPFYYLAGWKLTKKTSLQFLLDEFCEIFKTSFFLERLLGLYKIKRRKFWQLPLHSSSTTVIIWINKQTYSLQALTQTYFLNELFRKMEYNSKNVRGGVSFWWSHIWYNATEAGLQNGHFPWVFLIFSKHSPSRSHINVWYFNTLLVFDNRNFSKHMLKRAVTLKILRKKP